MPKKKICGIGVLAHQQKEIRELEALIKEHNKMIDTERKAVKRKKDKIKGHVERKKSKVEHEVTSSIFIPEGLAEKRQKLPTMSLLCSRTKCRRTRETFNICQQIHGGTDVNITPTVIGMLDTLAATTKSEQLAHQILQAKPSLTNNLLAICSKKQREAYHNSPENMMRSLNVYYSHNVMGKMKYMAIRRANKVSGKYNFIAYKILAKHMTSIDIGTLHDTTTLVSDSSRLEPGEDISGMYRDLREYALRLAKFYLTVNEGRKDKLNKFPDHPRKESSSILFLMAIGGDQAPLVGTSFLLSFLNIGKRIASSFDNFLIFASNAKENSLIVKLYLQKLLSDIRYLESQVFTFELNGQLHHVEFKLKLLPNDMKMLSFLAGELSNASTYFTTFANISKHDVADLTKRFAMDGTQFWKPWSYEDRIDAAAKVEEKKAEMEMKSSKSCRSNVTHFIGTELNSRQEFIPLLEEYIDVARCEPLHMKNNVIKDLFVKILEVVVSETNLPKHVSNFKEIPDENIFKEFVSYVRNQMKSNQLAQKVISWLNDNFSSLKTSTSIFDFRFRGKESRNYLLSFPLIISMLLKHSAIGKNRHVLYTIFYRSIALRTLISFTTRINDITRDGITEMEVAARRLYCASVLFEDSVSPSLWVLCNVAPCHTSEIFDELGYGLGINTMEGREQKHQQLKQYTRNTTVQNRWPQVFRHEYIQLVHLRQKGSDVKYYNKLQRSYFPAVRVSQCTCSLPLINDKCEICSTDEMKKISEQVESVM